MTMEGSRRVAAAAFRLMTAAVGLTLLLGSAADLACRVVCDRSAASMPGCHHHDADRQVVATGAGECHSSILAPAALPPDASRRVSLLVDAGHALPPDGPALSGRPAHRPPTSHAGSWRQLERRPRATVLRI